MIIATVLAATLPQFGCNSPAERAVHGADPGGLGGAGIGALASGGRTSATLGGAAVGTAPAPSQSYY